MTWQSSMKLCLAMSVVACCGCFAIQPALANPDFKSPDGYLDVHGLVPESKQLGEECIKLYEALNKAVADMSKKMDEKQLGVAYASSMRLERLLNRLKNFGEPLAYDLQTRTVLPDSILKKLRSDYIVSEKGRKTEQKIVNELRKKEKLRKSLVDKIATLNQQKHWEDAEREFDKTMGSLWQQTAYIDIGSAAEFGRPFEEQEEIFSPERSASRTKMFLAAKDSLRSEHVTSNKMFFDSLMEVHSRLSSKSNAAAADSFLLGPQAIRQFAADCGKVHLAIMQDATLEFLSSSLDKMSGSSRSGSVNEHPTMEGWVKEAASATQALISGVGGIMQSDAAVLSTEQAKLAYPQYLAALAYFYNRLSIDAPMTLYDQQLNAVAQKANMTSSVAAYRQATDDVLSWRSQVASRTSKFRREKQFIDIDELLRKECQNSDESPNFYTPSRVASRIPRVEAPIARMIPNAWNKIRNKQVSVGETIRFDSEKPLHMSRYYHGIYARPDKEIIDANAEAAIKRELLIDETHPPLTLAAAFALHEVQRGELMDLGGTIVGMHVESSSTRILKLPSTAGNFLRYSSLQNSAYPGDEMAGLCIRFDFKPTWGATHFQMLNPASPP